MHLWLSTAKRKASWGLLKEERNSGKRSENKKSKRRSVMEMFNGSRKNGKETNRFISMLDSIHAHRFNKKSRSRISSVNGWFGRSVENVANVSAVDEDEQKDCECCPAPRSGHRIFATEDFIYMIGGYRPSNIPDRTFTDVWRFNQLTEKWQKCEVEGLMPDCLASFSLVQTNHSNKVYAFGGTGVPFGNAASSDLYKFCVSDNGEIQLQKPIITGEMSQRPPKIYGQAMCFVKYYDENKISTPTIYLIGGTTGHEYNIDVWRLQLSNNNDKEEPARWESALLTARAYHNESGRYRLEVVFHENQIITFGGGAPDFCAEFDELLTFDLGTGSFIKLRTTADEEHGYPEGRKCHAIVEFEGEVYVIGGCREVITEPNARRECKMTNDVWKLNLASLSWMRLNTSLPLPVFFHSAAVTSEGCVYVFGGCTDVTSQSRTNKIFRMWLKPPPLRHLAMRVIRANYYPLAPENLDDMFLSKPNQLIRDLAC